MYEAYHRPLWDWALGLLDHPRLASHFVWDAEKIFKFNGAKWVRLYHEPWTSNDWWNVQVWCCTLSYPAALIMPNSQLFPMELNHFVSFFMLIRQDFHHLVLQRHIQLLPAAQTSRYIYGMVAALVAVKWLDGYQL